MKKKILSIIILSISIASLVGCTAKESALNNNVTINNETENLNGGEDIPVVEASGKLVNCYDTLGKINNDSEVVVKGTIIENEYVDYHDLTFTISKFKIDEVVKGDVSVGDTIKVLQTGGISEFKRNEEDIKSFEDPEEVEKYLKDKIGKKYEVAMEGVRVLKEGTSSVLLLQKYDGPVVEDAYVGTGDFQGRFILNKDAKSNTTVVIPQSMFLTEDITLDDLMNLK